MTARIVGSLAAAVALAASLSLLAAVPGSAAPNWDANEATGAGAADTASAGFNDYTPGPYRAGPAYVAPTADYASPYFAAPGAAGCGTSEPRC